MPPMASISSAMSAALRRSVPLKKRCSRKWETPFSWGSSSREPFSTQMPTVAEGIPGTSSEIKRSPLSSTVRRTISVLPLRTLTGLLHFALAQTNLALTIDLQHLHHDFIAFLEHIGHSPHPAGSDLRDVQQTVCPRQNLDERAKIDYLTND